MDKLNDKAFVYQLLNIERPKPHTLLGRNYTANYAPDCAENRLRQQKLSCEFRNDRTDEAMFWSYGSGCLNKNELIGGKYLQFLPLD